MGAGTARTLSSAPEVATHPFLNPAFTPSKAYGEDLAKELPKVTCCPWHPLLLLLLLPLTCLLFLRSSHVQEGRGMVLYPASAKAGSDIQEGLRARGFDVSGMENGFGQSRFDARNSPLIRSQVTRLNTYNTQPATSVDPVALERARKADVIAFASPSAIKAWIHHAGAKQPATLSIACIGETSASACRRAGLERIFSPDQPGLEGFVEAVESAIHAARRSEM